MVATYGMSEEMGLMAPVTVHNVYLEEQSSLDCSQETYAAIDGETKKLLNTCYADSVRILSENRELLDKIATVLLEKETITGEEMMAIINPPATEVIPEETPVEK